MSLITCCPACQTMFKVAGEDLRVSDGWVRCGRCDGVFDASAHLQVVPPEPDSSWPQDPLPESAESVESANQVALAATEIPAVPEAKMAFPVYVPAPSLDDAAAPASPARSDGPVAALDLGDFSPGALRREDLSSGAALPLASPAPLSFMGKSQERSPWRTVMWLLALMVLWSALVAWTRHDRQALVQQIPAALPVLDLLCAYTACEVQAPQLLEAVAIEGASMEEVGASDYKVQLLLKNSGTAALALPALDVTLTGLQGEVLSRHVELPAQYAPGVMRLLPGQPLSVAFSFQAALPVAPSPPPGPALEAPSAASAASAASAPPEVSEASPASLVPVAAPVTTEAPLVSGYRVLAFYP